MNKLTVLLLLSFFLSSFSILAQKSINQLLAEENYQEIIKTLSQKIDHLSKEEKLALAISYKQNGNPDKTIALLENSDVNHTYAEKQLLASTYFSTGNFKAAKPLCQSLLEEKSTNVANLLRLVEILEFYQDRQEALNYLTNYEKNDTTNFEVNKQLAKLYQKVDSTDKAIATYKRILNQYPENQTIGLLLGRYFLSLKKYPECNDLCIKFLKTNPHHRRFLLLGGLANFEAGAHQNTITLFNRLESQGDSSHITKKHLGITYYRLENFDKAIRYLKAAYKYKPEDPEVNFFLGASLGQSNQPQAGIIYLLCAAELISPAPVHMERIYNKLATIYFDTGKYQQSIQYYDKAHKYAPQTAQYVYHQASIYDHYLKDMSKAKHMYQKFLDNLPDNLDAKKGNERYAIQLKKVVESRLRELNEEAFFENGYTKSN